MEGFRPHVCGGCGAGYRRNHDLTRHKKVCRASTYNLVSFTPLGKNQGTIPTNLHHLIPFSSEEVQNTVSHLRSEAGPSSAPQIMPSMNVPPPRNRLIATSLINTPTGPLRTNIRAARTASMNNVNPQSTMTSNITISAPPTPRTEGFKRRQTTPTVVSIKKNRSDTECITPATVPVPVITHLEPVASTSKEEAPPVHSMPTQEEILGFLSDSGSESDKSSAKDTDSEPEEHDSSDDEMADHLELLLESYLPSAPAAPTVDLPLEPVIPSHSSWTDTMSQISKSAELLSKLSPPNQDVTRKGKDLALSLAALADEVLAHMD